MNLNGFLAAFHERRWRRVSQCLAWKSAMIRYVLRCDHDHKFEAWFRSQADCERLIAAGEATCPFCELSALSSVPAAPQADLANRTATPTRARLFRHPSEH